MTRSRKGRDEKSRRIAKKEFKIVSPKKVERYLEHSTCGLFNPESSIHDVIQHMDEVHQPIKYQAIRFEFALFIYLIAHLLIQNYNIYRVNFYNYNFYLLFLTIIILSKRFLLKYLEQIRRDNPFYTSGPHIFLNLIIILVVTLNAVYLITQLFVRHSFQNFMFLFYPYLVTNWWTCSLLANCHLLYSWMFSTIILGLRRKKNHASYQEDHVSKQFQQVVYSSLEYSYFTGILPLKFLQHDYLYFDMIRCTLLVFFVLLNSFVMLFSQLLLTSFTELYVHSQLLGYWKSSALSNEAQNGVEEWKPQRRYCKGTIVKYGNKYYEAQVNGNISRPGRIIPRILFSLFRHPGRMHKCLIGFQFLVALSQMGLLLNSNHWNVYGIMLIFNYYILFLCINTRRENIPLFRNSK